MRGCGRDSGRSGSQRGPTRGQDDVVDDRGDALTSQWRPKTNASCTAIAGRIAASVRGRRRDRPRRVAGRGRRCRWTARAWARGTLDSNPANSSWSRCIAGMTAAEQRREASARPRSGSRLDEQVAPQAAGVGGARDSTGRWLGDGLDDEGGLGGPPAVERGLAGPDVGRDGVEGELVVAVLDEQPDDRLVDLGGPLPFDPGSGSGGGGAHGRSFLRLVRYG